MVSKFRANYFNPYFQDFNSKANMSTLNKGNNLPLRRAIFAANPPNFTDRAKVQNQIIFNWTYEHETPILSTRGLNRHLVK